MAFEVSDWSDIDSDFEKVAIDHRTMIQQHLYDPYASKK